MERARRVPLGAKKKRIVFPGEKGWEFHGFRTKVKGDYLDGVRLVGWLTFCW